MAKRKVEPKSVRRLPDWMPYAAGVAALAAAVYANSVGNGFIGDDKIQLLKNPLVQDPAAIPKLLHSSVWSILGIPGNYYRPVQFLLYMLIYELAGFSAPWFHLFMVAVHAANCVMLFLLVRRMASQPVALAAAALFALHPIHTETVNWIAALPDLFVTTLALAGILWFARQGGAPRGLSIAGHAGIYLAALLTKETGLMVLPLYAGFGFFCLGRRWRELRQNAALYAAMVAAVAVYVAMRWNALGSLAPAQQTFFQLSLGEFIFSAVVTAAQYVGALVWPVNLNYFHIFHPTAGATAGFAAAAALLAGIGVAFWRGRPAMVRYGIFWFAVTLAPALNLTGVGQNVFAERYLYLPSAAFCWIAALGWAWLAQRRAAAAGVAGGAILLACGIATFARNTDWRDDSTLLARTLEQSPTSGWLHNSMAGVYIERNDFPKALAEERLAVQYEPRSPVFRRNLANILMTQDPRAALVEFQRLVEQEPGRAQNHCDLALALEATGDRSAAAAEYQRGGRACAR